MELDFRGVRDPAAKSHKPTPPPAIQRKSSFKEIQSAVSRIKPEILKSVIVAASGDYAGKQGVAALPSPAATAAPRCLGAETAPLTIFYNGKVVVVDLTPDKAKSILLLAEKGSAGRGGADAIESPAISDRLEEEKDCDHIFAKLEEGDLPIARRRSLQRFLQSRKKRLMIPATYTKENEKPIFLD